MKIQKNISLNALQSMKMAVLIIFGILTVLGVAAADEEPVYKKGSVIDLKVSCFDDNQSYCSVDTTCTITINKPDSTNLVSNEEMTRGTSYFNKTLLPSQTQMTGKYQAVVLCSGLTNGVSTFTFRINPSGSESLSIGFYLLLFFIPYGLLAFGVWKGDMPLAVFGTFGLYLLGIFLLIYGINGYKDNLVEGFSIITLGVAFYTSVRYAFELFEK